MNSEQKVIIKQDGSIKVKILGKYIQQGNNLVDTIFFGVEGLESTDGLVATANFMLPNDDFNSLTGKATSVEVDMVRYYGWLFTLTSNQTQYAGEVEMAIRITEGSKLSYSYNLPITINESVVDPTQQYITLAQYNSLVEALGQYQLQWSASNVLGIDGNDGYDSSVMDEGQIWVGYGKYTDGRAYINYNEKDVSYNAHLKELAFYDDLSAYLPLKGGTMSGVINMGQNAITELPSISTSSSNFKLLKTYTYNNVARKSQLRMDGGSWGTELSLHNERATAENDHYVSLTLFADAKNDTLKIKSKSELESTSRNIGQLDLTSGQVYFTNGLAMGNNGSGIFPQTNGELELKSEYSYIYLGEPGFKTGVSNSKVPWGFEVYCDDNYKSYWIDFFDVLYLNFSQDLNSVVYQFGEDYLKITKEGKVYLFNGVYLGSDDTAPHIFSENRSIIFDNFSDIGRQFVVKVKDDETTLGNEVDNYIKFNSGGYVDFLQDLDLLGEHWIIGLKNISNPTSAVNKQYVDSLCETIKKNSYQLVDTTTYTSLDSFLQSEGEEGYIYLYPIKLSDLTKGYYQYIWENSAWLNLGTTQIDLSNYQLIYDYSNVRSYLQSSPSADELNKLSMNQLYFTGGFNNHISFNYKTTKIGLLSTVATKELANREDLDAYLPLKGGTMTGALNVNGNNITNVRNITTSGDALNIKSTDNSQDFTIDIWNSGSSEISDIKLSKTKGNTLKQLILEFANDNVSLDVQTTDSNKNTYYADVVDVADDGSVDFISGAKSSVVPQNNNDLTNKEYVDTKIASSEKAQANGVATLDENGKIPYEQIPSNLINYKVFTRRFYGSSMTGDLYIDGIKREDIVANIGTDDGVKVRNDFDDMPFFGEINKVSLRAKDSEGNDLSDTNGTPIYDDFVFFPNYWYKVENGTDSSGNEYTDFSISTEEKTGYTRMKVNDDGSIPSHIGIGAYQSTYTLTSNSSYMYGSQKGQPICVNKNVDGYRNSYRYCLDYEHGIDTLTRIGSCSTQELDLPIIAMIIEFGNRNAQALFGGYLQGSYSGYQYLDATFKSYQSTEVCNYFIFPKATWTNFVNHGIKVGSYLSFYSYTASEYDRTSNNYWAKLTITAIEEYIVDEVVVGYKVSFDKTFTPSKNTMIGEYIAEEVGTTESIISSSGYNSRNFGLRSFTYRGIENLWGGFRTLTDKLFLKCTYENGVKTKLDIVKSDGTSTTDNWQTYQANVLPFLNGTSTNQSGYTKVFDFKKGMLLPKELQSGGSTYYNAWFGCYNNTNTYFNIIRGGSWYDGSVDWGLCWNVERAWSHSVHGCAVRPILYKNAS